MRPLYLLACVLLFGIQDLLAQPSLSPVVGPPLPHLATGALAWADYNGDGYPDLLISGQDSLGNPACLLLRNSSGGGMALDPLNPLPSIYQGDASWADMDGDGDPDLALCGSTGSQQGQSFVFQNNSGLLSPIASPMPALADGRLAWLALDGDNFPELAYAGFGAYGELHSGLLRQLGGNTFSLLGEGMFPRLTDMVLLAADCDGNGWTDIVWSGYDDQEGSRLYHFAGGGLVDLVESQMRVPPVSGGGMALADFDGDGKPELVATGASSQSHNVLYEYEAGNWLPKPNSLPLLLDSDAAVADYDGDGDLDLVMAGRASTGRGTFVFENDNGALVLRQSGPGLPQLDHCRIAFADWNQDGKLDFAISGREANGSPKTYILTFDNSTQTFKP